MAEPTSCCAEPGGYCARVDTLFNLPGVHVLDVAWHECRRKLPGRAAAGGGDRPSAEAGCPGCGVIAEARGRRVRRLHDIPAFGAPVELVWRQRRYRCAEPACPVRGFSEDHDAGPAAGQADRRGRRGGRSAASNATTPRCASVARRLGVDWHTVWEAIKPLLEELADDPDRLTGVDTVGVDEHIWHHQPRPGKGPKEQTGIVDLTRRNGRPRARLLDLVPGPVREGLRRLAAFPRERVHRRHRHRHAWTRSAATATRSATSSRTPPPSWTPSTWSGSA